MLWVRNGLAKVFMEAKVHPRYHRILITFPVLDSKQQEKAVFERTWLSEMMKRFVEILETIEGDEQGTWLWLL